MLPGQSFHCVIQGVMLCPEFSDDLFHGHLMFWPDGHSRIFFPEFEQY